MVEFVLTWFPVNFIPWWLSSLKNEIMLFRVLFLFIQTKNCAMVSILSSEKKNVFVFNFAHGKLTPVPRTHHVLVNTINDYFRVNQFQRHHLQENFQQRQTKDPVINLFILVWTDLFTLNIFKLLSFKSDTEQRFSSQNGFNCNLHIWCFLIA